MRGRIEVLFAAPDLLVAGQEVFLGVEHLHRHRVDLARREHRGAQRVEHQRVGRGGLAAINDRLGGEVVVDYALRLKVELSGKKTWVAGYANDVMAYIPSRRVLREGGYEGGGSMPLYGLPTIWSPAIENDIIDGVKKLLKD